MVTFRSNNNNRRPPYRSSNNRRPPFRRNDEGSKFPNNDSFQRRVPGRNNHNAFKLIEKYNDLAREALANEDKILSENYFQHADHFTRVQNEQELNRVARINSTPTETAKPNMNENVEKKPSISEEFKEISKKPEIKKITKNSTEKKIATS